MAMQYDISASAPATSSGSITDVSGSYNLSAVRIKAIYVTCSSDGYTELYDGTSASDPILLTLNTPPSTNSGHVFLLLPGEGILARNGVYAVVNGPSSVMVFYG